MPSRPGWPRCVSTELVAFSVHEASERILAAIQPLSIEHVALRDSLAFRTVVINLYRPAWNDWQPEGRRALPSLVEIPATCIQPFRCGDIRSLAGFINPFLILECDKPARV